MADDEGINLVLLEKESYRAEDIDDVKISETANASPKGYIASFRQFPVAIYFLLVSTAIESYAYYGVKTILYQYFILAKHVEGEDKDRKCALLIHGFSLISLSAFLPGGIIADKYFGRFPVIVTSMLIYAYGYVLFLIGVTTELSFIIYFGIVVFSVANGVLRPNLVTFCGEQFNANQKEDRQNYFSIFYMAMNLNIVFATVLGPILRSFHCLGNTNCHLLAFGIPVFVGVLSVVIFYAGITTYNIKPFEQSNIFLETIKCTSFGLKCKLGELLKCRPKEHKHWLDYSLERYSVQLVAGVKSIFGLFLLMVPIACFYVLYSQQDTTWMAQARQMNGRVWNFYFAPDQTHSVNPLLCLILVPLLDAVIYPAVNKLYNVTPLRKMGAGLLLCAFSFIIASVLQFKINQSMDRMPDGDNVFLWRFGNSTMNFTLIAKDDLKRSKPYALNWNDIHVKQEVPASFYTIYSSLNESIGGIDLRRKRKYQCGFVLGIYDEPSRPYYTISHFPYSCEKPNGMRIYFLAAKHSPLLGSTFHILDGNGDEYRKISITAPIANAVFMDIQQPILSSPYYKYTISNRRNCLRSKVESFRVSYGAAHIYHLDGKETSNLTCSLSVEVVELIQPNNVSILWQIPQIIVMAVAEILFAIPAIELVFSQPPPNMRSVVKALWGLTSGMPSNIVNMAIIGSGFFADPAIQFLVYAISMLLITIVFVIFAMKFTYVEEGFWHHEKGNDLKDE